MNWAVVAKRGIGGRGGGLENTRYLWLPQSRLIDMQSNFYLIFDDIWHVPTCLTACIVSNIDRWFAQHDGSYLTHSLSICWITESLVKAFAVWHKTVLVVLIEYIKMTKWTRTSIAKFSKNLSRTKIRILLRLVDSFLSGNWESLSQFVLKDKWSLIF